MCWATSRAGTAQCKPRIPQGPPEKFWALWRLDWRPVLSAREQWEVFGGQCFPVEEERRAVLLVVWRRHCSFCWWKIAAHFSRSVHIPQPTPTEKALQVYLIPPCSFHRTQHFSPQLWCSIIPCFQTPDVSPLWWMKGFTPIIMWPLGASRARGCLTLKL